MKNFPVIILIEHGKETLPHDAMLEYMRYLGKTEWEDEDYGYWE